jgi:hypothetical protein
MLCSRHASCNSRLGTVASRPEISGSVTRAAEGSTERNFHGSSSR